MSVFKTAVGEVAVVLLLLNNPVEKSASKAIWNDPPIHALIYVLAEIEALLSFTGWLVREVIGPLEKSFTLSIPLPVSSLGTFAGPDVTHYGVVPANLTWLIEVVQTAVDAFNPFATSKNVQPAA